MKKTMRFLGAVFTVIMLLCCTQVAFAADYTLTTDAPITATLDYNNRVYYADIYFTPEVEGTYKVTFKGDGDYEVYLDDYIDCDEIYYTEIVEHFKDDCQYLFELSLDTFNFNEIKPINIEVEITLLCEHKNTSTIPETDFTCTQDGGTEKIICDDCGWAVKENIVYPARHLDSDNDYICDVCGEEALLVSDSYTDPYYEEGFDEEPPYTTTYKFYANGDLYIGGNGEFAVYEAYELKKLFDKFIDPLTDNYIVKFRNIYVDKDVEEIYIGKAYGGEKYIVDTENKNYSSDSYGVLFSKDGKSIVDVPALWKETSYDIPFGVERIEWNAFSYAKHLTDVTVPTSVKYIGCYAFNLDVLTCDETVDGLIYIGDALVDDICRYDFETDEYIELEVAKIRDGTRIIAEDVGGCDGIIYEIPDSVECISEGLYSLASAYLVDDNNNYFSDIDGVLFNKDKTVLINYPGGREGDTYVVPAGVKEIGEDAFVYSEITKVVLPEGLEKIGDAAFNPSNLKEFNLPSSLKEIGDYAFDTDDKIKAVVLHKNIEKIGSNSFNCDNLVILNPECEIVYLGYYSLIIGYSGSTAEKYANDHNIPFATLGDINGENHQHIYIPETITAATCTENGEESFSCPCGNTETYTRVIEARGHRWWYEDEERYCVECDLTESIYYDCDCDCHEEDDVFKMFFFKIKVFFWKLFKPDNRYCYCGDYHW